jgi:hypothetical protein
MMNEDELLRKLAQTAKNEPVPPLDVTAGVRLRIEKPERDWSTRLLVAAALMAASVLSYAYFTWFELDDPFRELVMSLNMVLR